jgi:SAM-dependent methyltransferase
MSNAKSDNDSAADPTALMQLLWPGPLVVQAISTAARLKIADRLAERPQTTENLADSSSVRPKTLGRLLTALTSVGLFSLDDSGNWLNTPLSELLRENHPRSMRPWALTMGAPFFWLPMGELHHSVATGKESFTKAFSTDFFNYLKANPEAGTLFNQAMAAQSTGVLDEIPEAYDFSQFNTIVDLGGGTGSVVATILRANPGLEAVLFELPDVIDEVEPSLMDEFGGRLTLQSGNFLDDVPKGIDCYMTVRVIHDWPDDNAVKILQNIGKAMTPDGTLLLVEGILEENAPPNYAMMDMLMLVLAGSMERTEEDFRALLDKGGFDVIRTIRHGWLRMLECKSQ